MPKTASAFQFCDTNYRGKEDYGGEKSKADPLDTKRAVTRCTLTLEAKAVVIGIGTDLMEIERVAHSIERFGARFLERVYTPREIAYCQRKKKTAAESFAARFAAKEAGAKALGTGISNGVNWLELEVGREPGGRPTLVLHGRAAERALQMGVVRISPSLTHNRNIALAVVVMGS